MSPDYEPDADRLTATGPGDGARPPPPKETATHPGRTAAFPTPTGPSGGEPDAADPPRVGRFELLGEVARGGMGVVHRARDPQFDREVAIKLVQPSHRENPAAVARFLAEAAVTGRLQHPGIPPVFEVGTDPVAGPFLAMKLIKGKDLDELLRTHSDLGRLVAVFEQVCHALAYAHSKGVIHRDLKPGNVMVGAFGEVQVMDWGLAKVLVNADVPTGDAGGSTFPDPRAGAAPELTRAGSALGTPAYMPPEQAAGAVDLVDRRSDVFGLGGILCAVLTGQPPFTADSAEATRLLAAQGRLDGAFARLDACGADPELVALAKRCLAPAQNDRPADAGEVAAAVAGQRAAAEDRARRAEVDRAAAGVRAAEGRKRRRLAVGLMAAVTVALAGGMAATFRKYQDEAAQRVIADREREDAKEGWEAARLEAAAKDAARREADVQRDAAESALVRGYVNSLSGIPGAPLSPTELSALRDLAGLPDARLRLVFIERAIALPGGSYKLLGRADEVTHALVGWDRGNADALRREVTRLFAANAGGPDGPAALAAVLAVLPSDDPADDARAALVLAQGVGGNEAAVREMTRHLTSLAGRLGSAEALPPALHLAGWLEPPAKYRPIDNHLMGGFSALARRLEPGAAAVAARDFIQRMTRGRRTSNLLGCARGLAALADRLGPDQAEEVARALAGALVEVVSTGVSGDNAQVARELAYALAAVAVRLPQDRAAAVVLRPTNEMAARFPGARYPDEEAELVRGLGALAACFTQGQETGAAAKATGVVSRALVVRASRGVPTQGLAATARVLGSLAGRLPPEPAGKAVALPAQAFADRMSGFSGMSRAGFPEEAEGLAALAPHVRPSQVKYLLDRLEGALKKQVSARAAGTTGVGDIARGFAAVVARLEPARASADAKQAARPVADGLWQECRRPPQYRDLAHVQDLTHGLATLLGRVDPSEAAALTEGLPAALSEVILGTTDSDSFGALVVAFDRLVLTTGVDHAGQSSGALALELANRTAAETDPRRFTALAAALGVVAPRLPDAELLELNRRLGLHRSVRAAVLAGLGRRGSRPVLTGPAAVTGTPAACAPRPFADVWEFVAWAEANRPDLDLKSRLLGPGN